MTPLTRIIHQNILKPLSTMYHDDDTLILILKRRLTKKEYKLLIARAQGESSEEQMREKLALDTERHEILWQKIVKKLNNDAIKRELYSY
jgi:hypothetical protein